MIPHNLFPEGTKYCVAGGYAACPALANDIDVWVYGVAADDLQIARAELLLHIVKQDFHVSTEGGDNIVSEEYESENQRCSILKVAAVGIGRGNGNMPLHIMVTDAKTPVQILQNFDVSTHAVALTPGGVVKHPKWTPPHVPPVALLDHKTTPARMERIARRFGHLPAEETDIPF